MTMAPWLRYRLIRVLVPVCLFAVLTGRGRAQSSLIETTPLGRDRNGWRLYNATASFGYSTLALPNSSSANPFSLERLGGDYDSTVSTSVGYNYIGQQSSVSLLYSPSYVRRVRYSELSTLNQSLN